MLAMYSTYNYTYVDTVGALATEVTQTWISFLQYIHDPRAHFPRPSVSPPSRPYESLASAAVCPVRLSAQVLFRLR